MDDSKRPLNLKSSEDFGISLRLMNDGTLGGQAIFNPAKSLLQEGAIVQERYKIVRPLGAGGMGAVYLAEHILFHRSFALKTLDPSTLTDIVWRRFQKEAHAANMLDHPSLIKVTDFGVIDGRQPYFVMDYFDGITLSSALKSQGSLSQDLALDVTIKICDALGYAHSKGVIHRDIKPSNIMLTKESSNPEIKIVDFGLAKLLDGDHEANAVTKTGEVFGTAFYMSPEQCLGKTLDHRADIYSIGCLLFELLTGTPPFDGDTALPVMLKHQNESPPSLREASLGKSFPKDLEAVVKKLLEKEPKDRYQSLTELARDLRKIGSGERIAISVQNDSKKNTTSSRHPIFAVGIATFIIVAIAASAFFLRTPQKAETTAPAPHVDALQVLDNANPSNAPEPEKPSYEGGFFSEVKQHDKRIFHFPFNLEESPGRISELPSTTEVKSEDQNGKPLPTANFAVGNMTIQPFAPFRLTATDYICIHTQMFKRFRPDEVRSLRLNGVASVTDRTIEAIPYFTGLEGLEMDECTGVTDESLKDIDKMPNLTVLTLGRTKTTGEKIAKLKHLRSLKMLDLRTIKHTPLVLQALKNSNNLTLLGLRMTGLKDSDLASLSKMTKLERLDLSDNDITSKGLAQLQSLTKLTDLDLSDCPISQEATNMFAPFKNLKSLKLSLSNWKPYEVKRLEQAMKQSQPDCKLHDATSKHPGHSIFSLLR